MTLALEALIDGDWYIEQLENVVYSSDDSGTHEVREKVKQTIKTLRLAIDAQNMASEPVVDFCRECLTYNGHHDGCSHAIKALEEALAKQEQGEPDKYVMDIECTKCGAKQSGILTVNTTPQPAQKPLTDEQIDEATQKWAGHTMVSLDRLIMCREYARAIEAAHGIKS